MHAHAIRPTTSTSSGADMTDERRFEEMLAEFDRVGVDRNSFPAGLAVSRGDVMRILRSLPTNAGPEAFLAKLREEQRMGNLVSGEHHTIEG
jgi:hypothetical protein